MTKQKPKTTKAVLYEGSYSYNSRSNWSNYHTVYITFPGSHIGILRRDSYGGSIYGGGGGSNSETQITTKPLRTLELGSTKFKLNDIKDEKTTSGGMSPYYKDGARITRTEIEVPTGVPQLLRSQDFREFYERYRIPIFQKDDRDWVQRFQDLERILEVCRERGLFIKDETLADYITRVKGLRTLSYPPEIGGQKIPIHNVLAEKIFDKQCRMPLTRGKFQTGDLVRVLDADEIGLVLGQNSDFWDEVFHPEKAKKGGIEASAVSHPNTFYFLTEDADYSDFKPVESQRIFRPK